jgi:hypothetical protein
MRKSLALAALITIGCAGMLTCNFTREGYVVKLTEEWIQKKLDAKFPITKRYLLVFDLTLKDPQAQLVEGSDRIGFGLSAGTNVRVNDEDLAGKAFVTAGVRYDPEKGALLLVDPTVERLNISLLPEKYENEVTAAASIAVKEYLDDYEVYRLDTSDRKLAIAKYFIKDVVVREGVARITLGVK